MPTTSPEHRVHDVEGRGSTLVLWLYKVWYPTYAEISFGDWLCITVSSVSTLGDSFPASLKDGFVDFTAPALSSARASFPYRSVHSAV